MRASRSLWTVALALAGVLLTESAQAQDAKAATSPAFRAAEQRIRDEGSLFVRLAEGKFLYERDRIKLSGFQYCGQAVALAERGEFRSSIRAAAKALYLGQAQSNDELEASAKRDLAIAYSYAGELELAEKYAKEALQHKSAASPVIAGPVNKIIGDVLVRRGRIDEAINAYQIAVKTSSAKYRPLVEMSLANAYVAVGDLERARGAYARMPVPQGSGAPQLYRRGLANLRLSEGKPEEALALFNELLKNLGGIDDQYHRLWALDGIGRAHLAMGDRSSARRSVTEALSITDDVRARFRSDELKMGLFGDLQQVFERGIALAADDNDAEGAWAISEASRARALLDVVRGRVNLESAAQADPLSTKPLPLSVVRETLRDDEAIVQYHSLDDRLVAWVIRRDGISMTSMPLSRAILDRDVKIAIEGVRSVAEALYHQLFDQLALRPLERVVIVPHGGLYYLPFQGLRTGDGFLIERHAIALSPSSSVAVQLARRDEPVEGKLVAFGNPLINAAISAQYDFPRLDSAEREVARIGNLFPDPLLYVGREASKSRLNVTAPDARVLHIAAHANVDPVDPMHSSIFLAEDGSDLGALEAREVYNISLRNTSLVALSACQTGLGTIKNGNEILGFTRSFLTAGVSTLLVSLWPVQDESTELLMTTFYGELAKGAEAIDAMRTAQLTVLKEARFSHPFFWAPFNLIGNWRLRTTR